MGRLINRWTVGLGVGALTAWWIARETMTPPYPDVALQAGLELVAFPRRVLAVSPHPADLEWFAGGTCFLLKQAGGEITVALVTEGEQGGNRANMGEIRMREEEQSAAILGYDKVVHLRLPDQAVRAEDLVPRLNRLWREVRPDVVLTFDPAGLVPGLNAPDHTAAGSAVLELIRDGLAAGGGERVYLYGTRNANVTVDITEVLQEKESAVLAHRSQMRGPDAAARLAFRGFNRLSRGRTPAFYTESFYRLV